MLIFYIPYILETVNPVVVLDYTRSDDQYSMPQILSYVQSLGIQAAKGKSINIGNLSIYSLEYSMTFTHSGNNYGDSLKTKFTANIQNAPTELISMLNVKNYIGSENIDALQGALSSVVDPQVYFPTGAFVIKTNSNTAPNILSTIHRTFMVYDTPFNFDARRINSTLIIHGSEYDSMVMRLQFAVSISKLKGTLISQLTPILAKQGFVVNADPSATAKLPEVDRYYPPAPMNSILNEVCRDNNLIFKLNSDLRIVKFNSLSGIPPIPDSPFLNMLCFNNFIPNTKLISTFSLQNYATCQLEAEAFDVKLFDTILIYDDTLTSDPTNPISGGGVFSNLKKTIPFIIIGKAIIFPYNFYVLEYTYTDNRYKTSITIRATNNWLLNNFKLDSFLENKIYLAPSIPANAPVMGSPI